MRVDETRRSVYRLEVLPALWRLLSNLVRDLVGTPPAAVDDARAADARDDDLLDASQDDDGVDATGP
jgi:hypothetical protein